VTVAQPFVSKPTTCWASVPVTPANRAEVLAWTQRWGGHGALTPDGYEVMLVLYTDHGELDVPEGGRVVYDGGNWWSARSDFEDRWSPLPGDAEAGDAPLLGEATGGA
jgi:hypothetical protein